MHFDILLIKIFRLCVDWHLTFDQMNFLFGNFSRRTNFQILGRPIHQMGSRSLYLHYCRLLIFFFIKYFWNIFVFFFCSRLHKFRNDRTQKKKSGQIQKIPRNLQIHSTALRVIEWVLFVNFGTLKDVDCVHYTSYVYNIKGYEGYIYPRQS